MKISIYGTGCPKCKKTAEVMQEAVDETGIDAEVVKVTDIKDIVTAGVMSTPAVGIDGAIKVTGRVPSLDEAIKWIEAAGK